MRFTAAHWGVYTFDGACGLVPIADDPMPSRIGHGWVSAARDPGSRILAPAIRKGWLEGDEGSARSGDSFVKVAWEEATNSVAGELSRVRDEHGNSAIFGGSYGWASAGRFHHAQSQLRRFLNCFGGYTGSRNTYSHAAAEVVLPYLTGMSNRQFQDEITSVDEVAEYCELLLAFGGISDRTSQITSSGTSRHEIGGWVERCRARRMRIVNISPQGSDMPGAEWLSIRPGTDAALMLALAFEVVVSGRADEGFLDTYTSGWPMVRRYLEGTSDNIPKSAEWASDICDVPAHVIKVLASDITTRRTMIALNWGLQRADHGEQPLWAGLTLAAVIGQIGKPGTGFAFGYGSSTPVGRPTRLIPWPSVPQGRNPIEAFIPVARIADALLHPASNYTYAGENRRYPDIRLVYWAGGNPFHHHQDLTRLEDAWERPETIIVHDHAWTATARRADIVLPATTPLERDDIMINRRDRSLIYMSPLFAPMGQALDDFEIFRRIARHLGIEEAYTDGRDQAAWLRQLWVEAQEIAKREGFTLPDFASFKEMGRFNVPNSSEHRRAFGDFIANPDENALSTESGKITLWNDTIADYGLEDCPGHATWFEPTESLLNAPPDALHLISGQPATRLHGQNDRGDVALADKIKDREPAYLHPEAAADRELEEGDVIRIWNDRGACLAGLRFNEMMRADCVALATGAWYDPQFVNGRRLEVHGNPNVLTLDKGCSGLSQGNIAHTALVFVEKWEGELPPLKVNTPPEFVKRAEVKST